jgi:hypothetical protein
MDYVQVRRLQRMAPEGRTLPRPSITMFAVTGVWQPSADQSEEFKNEVRWLR